MSDETTPQQFERVRARLRVRVGDTDRISLQQARLIARETELPLRAVEDEALAQGILPERYERNIGTLGIDGQRALLNASVAVVGLGGLGGHVLETLARSGAGRVVGIDPDAFKDSNLNRQLLSTVENLECSKVEQAGERLARVNPATAFCELARRVEDVPDDVLRQCRAVFDCLDSIAARLALSERCASMGVLLVHGAIAGWGGQVAVCPPGAGVMERLYTPESRGMEGRLGNLACTAAVAANVMVARALPLLANSARTAVPEVVFFDLLGNEWETVEF